MSNDPCQNPDLRPFERAICAEGGERAAAWRAHRAALGTGRVLLRKESKPPPDDPGLGDEVEAAIKLVGLDRLAKLYEEVTGRSCGCAGRKAKLNRLPGIRAVVRRVLGGDQGGSTSMD